MKAPQTNASQTNASQTNAPGSGAASVLDELVDAWRRTDELFEIVGDAWLERPIPLRHPFLFYLGHLPAFAWNQVCRGVLGRGACEAHFDELFERGIDPLDEAEAERAAIHDWPTVSETLSYRDRVRDELRSAVSDVAARGGEDVLARGLRIYHLVLEHELMHHETLFYLLHELDHEKKRVPSAAPDTVGGAAPPPERLQVPAGRVTIGASFDEVPFGWDNEFPAQVVDVPTFGIDRRPVTVGDFRRFVEAGGYAERRYWSLPDWEWLQKRGQRSPHRWEERGGEWMHRTMFGWERLDSVAGWPVQVSGAEALAYCRWRGARLPSEAEIRRAAYGSPEGPERSFPWGEEAPDPSRGNFDFAGFDPLPVGSRPAGQSAFGVDELVGNGWEWTSTDFGPLPGFEPWARTYPGYSADFFDGEHAVIFGASWATSARLLRRSFRNWFQRRYVYVPATFRCAW